MLANRTYVAQNEPNAAKRVVEMFLTDATGLAGVSPALVAGDCKIKPPGGAIAQSVNLPAALAGAMNGAFTLQLDPAEVTTVGLYYGQVTHAGMLSFPFFYFVDDGLSSAAVAGVFAKIMDPNAPVGAQTFQQMMNILVATVCGPGDGIDGPVGSVSALVTGDPVAAGAKHRGEFTVVSGKRRWTKFDGT